MEKFDATIFEHIIKNISSILIFPLKYLFYFDEIIYVKDFL